MLGKAKTPCACLENEKKTLASDKGSILFFLFFCWLTSCVFLFLFYQDDVAHASLTAPLDEVVKMLCQEHGMTYDPTASSAVSDSDVPRDGQSTG